MTKSDYFNILMLLKYFSLIKTFLNHKSLLGKNTFSRICLINSIFFRIKSIYDEVSVKFILPCKNMDEEVFN